LVQLDSRRAAAENLEHMQLSTALALAALGASVLSLGGRARLVAIIALCVSGLEVALAFGVVTFGISGMSVPLILGAALAITGALLFARTEAKTQVAAATVLTLVGLIQALSAMRLID
jgi:hypothetical protein